MARPDRFASRRRKLARKLAARNLDGLLVTTRPNVYYLTGFRGDDSTLLIGRDDAWLMTDSRYTEEAEAVLKGVGLVARTGSMMKAAARTARKAGIERLGVEAVTMTLAQRDDLEKWRGRMAAVSTKGLVEDLRVCKDASEIAAIRRAIAVAEKGFRLAVAQIRPGMTEREAAIVLERRMQDLGADAPAFPTICAAGPRASLPHAMPTDRRVRPREPVLFDWGARVGMVHSDLTRMVCWDRIPVAFGRLYTLVLDAQRRAVAALRPGRSAGQIDHIARTYLKAHRHGRHFGHGLGHGIGLEVHEAPGIRPGQETVLRAGMVFSVEPGVYLPGRCGVRIEDLALVTPSGHTVLTSQPRGIESVLAEAV